VPPLIPQIIPLNNLLSSGIPLRGKIQITQIKNIIEDICVIPACPDCRQVYLSVERQVFLKSDGNQQP
jgi:hypothetical protein